MRIRKFARSLTSKTQDDALPSQQRKEKAMGNDKMEKRKVLDEAVAMEDKIVLVKPIGDVKNQDDALPPPQRNEEAIGDEKKVVDETIAIEKNITRMKSIGDMKNEDDALPMQQRKEEAIGGKKKINRKVVNEIVAIEGNFIAANPIDDAKNQDDALSPQQRKEEAIRDEKKKKKKRKVVDEIVAMEDNIEAKPIGDVKKQDDIVSPLQRKEKAIGINEKKKKNRKVVDEIVAKEDNIIAAKPIGNVIKISGEGKGKKNHFASFEYDGIYYDIGDSVMLWPQEKNDTPYVAIIKDISQASDQGSMMVKVQWFYRPEDTKRKGGGTWKSSDTREIFYSFHQDETPVESIIHKCVVHFIPSDKPISYMMHPGFIVHKLYDPILEDLFELTDDVYVKDKREEINQLIQKSMSTVRELPNIDPKDIVRKKRTLRR